MRFPEQLEDVTIYMARLREIDRARLAELLSKKPLKKWHKDRWWHWREMSAKDNARLKTSHTEDLPTFIARLHELNRARVVEPRRVKPQRKRIRK